MIRRLLNVAAVLSLLAALLLALGRIAYTPGVVREFGEADRGWCLLVGDGYVGIAHKTAVVAMIGLGDLALPFALWPLAWGVVLYRRERRQWARGFPVEVSRHAPPINPTANRSPETPGGEAGPTASGEPHPQG